MWHIDKIERPDDATVTLIGGKGDDVGYRSTGDRFGPEGSQYIVYVEGVGAVTLKDVGHRSGGPHYWAVEVNGSDYWYYDGEGRCTLAVETDGSFELRGQHNHVSGQAIPEKDVEFQGYFQQTVGVDAKGFSLDFFDERVQAYGLLADGDTVNFLGPNNRYVTTGEKKQVVATGKTPGDAAKVDVVEDGDGLAFRIDGSFVRTDPDSQKLYADAKRADATAFSIVLTAGGSIGIETDDGYLQLAKGGNAVTTTASRDYYSGQTSFGVGFERNAEEDVLARHGVRAMSETEIGPCEMAWATFVWDLTGGFFLAIGLGPYIATGTARTGVLGLLRSNQRVWSAIQRLVSNLRPSLAEDLGELSAKYDFETMTPEDVAAIPEEDIEEMREVLASSGISVQAALDVVKTIYEEGLLWEIFKMVLSTAGWWIAPWILYKVIMWVFAPEEQVAEVLAGATVWAVKVTNDGLKVKDQCDRSTYQPA